MSKFREMESTYLYNIRTLEKEQNSLDENDLSGRYDLDFYVKRQELKNYISNYRFALRKLRECTVRKDIDKS